MERASTAQAEGMTREKLCCWRPSIGEAAKATQRVFALRNELVSMHQAGHVAEEKVSSVAAEAATSDRRWEAAEEQCET
jgi:hypothetical protein